MAEALEALYPGVKFGIGPAIENGFYYDVDLGGQPFSQEDFARIEEKMLELARQKNAYVRKPVSKADALNYFTQKATNTNSTCWSGSKTAPLRFIPRAASWTFAADRTFPTPGL